MHVKTYAPVLKETRDAGENHFICPREFGVTPTQSLVAREYLELVLVRRKVPGVLQ